MTKGQTWSNLNSLGPTSSNLVGWPLQNVLSVWLMQEPPPSVSGVAIVTRRSFPRAWGGGGGPRRLEPNGSNELSIVLLGFNGFMKPRMMQFFNFKQLENRLVLLRVLLRSVHTSFLRSLFRNNSTSQCQKEDTGPMEMHKVLLLTEAQLEVKKGMAARRARIPDGQLAVTTKRRLSAG